MKINFDTDSRTWVLSWEDTKLEFQIRDGDFICTYFGESNGAPSPVFRNLADTLQSTRSVARLHLAPDDRPTTWDVKAWSQVDDHAVMITLADRFEPLEAELQFVLDPPTHLLRCKTRIRNTGEHQSIRLTGAVSFSVTLPEQVREAVYLVGSWTGETQMQRIPIQATPLHLESRSGKSGFEFSPYLAVLSPTHTYVFQLHWSGNWQMNMRRDFTGEVQVSGGLNDWGLRHTLGVGDSLELPDAAMVFCKGDLNAATQRLHDYRRHVVRPNPEREIPVQFNTWYPSFGEIAEGVWGVKLDMANLRQSVENAAKLGCEVYVLDGGWYAFDSDPTDAHWFDGVGDWVASQKWFPNGLEELSAYCHAHNIAFGIWFEPEASGPGSSIQLHHPEWLHTLQKKLIPHGRYQHPSRALLNLGIPEARAFQRERILAIARANGATWIKWDFNMNLNQGAWAEGLPDSLTQTDPLIAHCRGVYTLMDEIREAITDLTLENCSSGGGRFDPGIAAHAHVHWASDEIKTLRRLAINFGSLLAHPAIEVNTWLVDWPPHQRHSDMDAPDTRGDLPFRLHAAMLGSFGISAPTWQWSADELVMVREHIDVYKSCIRPILHTGDQYILTEAPPLDGNGDWAAIWYIAKVADKGVLFVYRLASTEAQRTFRLPGLDFSAHYVAKTVGNSAPQQSYSHENGLSVQLDQTYRSAIFLLEKQNH